MVRAGVRAVTPLAASALPGPRAPRTVLPGLCPLSQTEQIRLHPPDPAGPAVPVNWGSGARPQLPPAALVLSERPHRAPGRRPARRGAVRAALSILCGDGGQRGGGCPSSSRLFSAPRPPMGAHPTAPHRLLPAPEAIPISLSLSRPSPPPRPAAPARGPGQPLPGHGAQPRPSGCRRRHGRRLWLRAAVPHRYKRKRRGGRERRPWHLRRARPRSPGPSRAPSRPVPLPGLLTGSHPGAPRAAAAAPPGSPAGRRHSRVLTPPGRG